MSPQRRLVMVVFATTGVLAALSSCGIRPTEGPVGAGKPANRTTPSAQAQLPGTERHIVYLVKDNRLQALPRTGRLQLRPAEGNADRVRAEQVNQLLEELHLGPNDAEALDGFTTGLPAGGLVAAPQRDGDPPTLFRLDAPLSALATVALGQVVCTLQSASGGDTVLLSGRRGTAEAYRCESYLDMSRKVPGAVSPSPPRFTQPPSAFDKE
ncbi:hypothetical protein [Streptomyces sp. SID3343]|uniref:hypothetical protein n=1 Tax=Streptomyces sp. SID3343 TaxID=2690260 RepID=UPI00136D8DB7|nr:hypothetical protein [Streptomyces sp. SID3343]MYW06337.1 hypothetical protein [Streptomyces sp. SID3343]